MAPATVEFGRLLLFPRFYNKLAANPTGSSAKNVKISIVVPTKKNAKFLPPTLFSTFSLYNGIAQAQQMLVCSRHSTFHKIHIIVKYVKVYSAEITIIHVKKEDTHVETLY